MGCLIFVRSRDKLRQVVKEISGTHAGGFKGRISKRQHQAQLSVRETVTSTPAIFLHSKAAREEGWNFEAGSRKACSRSQTAMLRYKQVIGRSFGARSLPAQEEIEAKCGCLVITQTTDYLRILQLASLPRHSLADSSTFNR
jgi:hypothetical protein